MSPPNQHVVVDGSNIATEGRSLPSLQQLDEAVRSFVADHPKAEVTVVVDATFAHRIKPKERKTFEAAVDAGEIVVPPAGAVGRGDAFILQVAAKANSVVLSNDSFQEFHGEHPWLFEVGRLIGAKPVEGVGWIFVDRVPVRGQESRRATRAAGSGRTTKPKSSKGSDKGSARDTKPKRGRASDKKSREAKAADKRPAKKTTKSSGRSNRTTRTDKGRTVEPTKADKKSTRSGRSNDRKRAQSPASGSANTPEQFLGFVTRHSIGDTVVGTVDQFSSHGCYLQIASARVYLPSNAMGDPPPSRARDVVSVGQKVRVRVESLDADRRGINVELIEVLDTTDKRGNQKRASSQRRRGKQKESSQKPTSVADGSAREANLTRSKTIVAKSTKKSPARRAKKSAKKATSGAKKTAKATPSTRAKKAAAKKATKKAPASRAPKKAAAKKSTKKAPAKKAAAKKSAPKKTAAKKSTKKAAAKKSTKKAAPKKAAAKKSTKKAAPKKTAAKKSTKKAAPKKAAAKKSTKKAAPKKAAAKKSTKKAPASRAPKKAAAKKSTKKASRRKK